MTQPPLASSLPSVLVRVTGRVRGRDVDAIADASVRGEALALHWQHEAQPWRIEWHGIQQVAHEPQANSARIQLHLAGGDTLTIDAESPSSSLTALWTSIEHGIQAMPELTRGLRAMGSRRGRPGAEHDLWFAPLLQARRAVEGVGDLSRQLTLLDASSLRRAFDEAMAQIAALREPANASRQRAVEAVLEEEAEPVFIALERLARVEQSLRESSAAERIVRWRAWTEELKRVFVAADEAWLRVEL